MYQGFPGGSVLKKMIASWQESMTNLHRVLKSKDITWLTKVYIVKAMVFPLVTYGCESWTVKKAEHQRMDAFELWCWRRLLKVHWTARRSNQSMLRKGQPWILVRRTDAEDEASIIWSSDVNSQLTGKDTDARKDWGLVEKRMTEDGWMASPTQWTWVQAISGRQWRTGKPILL